MRRIFHQIYTTFKFLTLPCDRWKRKFVAPINTIYFIKYVFRLYTYVFRLYTKNTAVLDIGQYFGQWKEAFPQPF